MLMLERRWIFCRAAALFTLACGGQLDRAEPTSDGAFQPETLASPREVAAQDPLATPPPLGDPRAQQPAVEPAPEPTPDVPSASPSCLADPECRWSLAASMPTHSRGQAAVASGGSIYLVGGEAYEEEFYPSVLGGSQEYPSTLPAQHTALRAYDPASRTWSEKARLPSGLYVLTAHAIAGKIYAFGGWGTLGFDATTRAYDPASDTWEALAPMPTPRYMFTSEAVGDKVYVVGGIGPAPAPAGADDWNYKTNVDIFDPRAGWSSGAPTPEPLGGAASCALGERIFVFGGEFNNLTSIYDVTADSWTEAAPPPLARNGHSCRRVGSAFYLFGGRDVASVTLDVVEKYDPATGSWQTLEPMPTARLWFGAAALGSHIYTFGGLGLLEGRAFWNGLLDVVEVLSVEP
jgi:N-acetylneuraminic acid mutarotase